MRSRSEMALEWLAGLITGVSPESAPREGFTVAERAGPSRGHRNQRRTVRLEPISLTGAGEMRGFGPTARPVDVNATVRAIVFYPNGGDDLPETARRMSDAGRLLVDLYTNAVLSDDGTDVHVSSTPLDTVSFGTRIPDAPAGAKPIPTVELDIRLRYTEEA